jgi:glutamine cyclotransferase
MKQRATPKGAAVAAGLVVPTWPALPVIPALSALPVVPALSAPPVVPALSALPTLQGIIALAMALFVGCSPSPSTAGAATASAAPPAAAPAAPPASPASPAPPAATASPAAGGPKPAAGPLAERLVVRVLSQRPHDPSAYTQGLVWDHGKLYESTGLYGEGSLREVDPETGEVRRQLKVPPGFFAEGLAQVGQRLVQLTWKEGVAFIYDVKSFERVGEYHYQGEGWGLCNDGRRLVMSDGSDRLSFRDPATFALLGGVDVRLDGLPVRQLNELECVDGAVWSNVWMTDQILRIDPASGRVTAVVDAAGLLDAADLAHADVLNGIAYDPAKKTFLITGKLWPKMFEVLFVPAPR